jgi:hypothetical protein
MLVSMSTAWHRYFLVTPKLLPHLSYNARVKVHCVYNGDGVPARERWNADEFVRRHRQAQAAPSVPAH